MEKFCYRFINALFGIAMCGIMLLILFFQFADYAEKKDFMLSNLSILGMLIIFFILCLVIHYFLKNKMLFRLNQQEINYDKIVLIFSAVLFVGQAYVCYNIFFLTGWDARLVRDSAQLLATGNMNIEMQEYYGDYYYSYYPNNLFIFYLTALILKVNNSIGIFTGEYTMMSTVLVNCIINVCTCLLVYKTANLFVEKKFAFIGYCISVLLFGFSPWSVIFYSDSVGLIIPILVFYLYVRPISHKILRYVFRCVALAIGVIGYFVKPQSAIMLIAIMLIEIIWLFNGFKAKKLIRPLALFLVCVVCFLTVTQAINATSKKIGFNIDPDKKIGATHFFMMGLEESTGGTYFQDDVDFSKSFKTVEERKIANIKSSIERLKGMGIIGYIKHISKKMLTTFNDGTFAWNNEGGFYLYVPNECNKRASGFLINVYYGDGMLNRYFLLFEQTIWILVLIGCIISVVLKNKASGNSKTVILRLAVLGLILFECLFEVRARYLYTFAPVFCILAILGIKQISQVAKKIMQHLVLKRGN